MAIRAHYLDASAAVKLVLKKGSHELESYIGRKTSVFMTGLCLAEALSVFKRYYLKKDLTKENYHRCCGLLMDFVRGDSPRIHIDSMDLMNQSTFLFCDDFVMKYHLDYSDALQLVSIKYGRFNGFVGESKTLLITADRQLAKAAEEESISVWNCIETLQPT